ncbi:MAG: hypothetical protein RLY16_2353 [Bacteroidota bacterium]
MPSTSKKIVIAGGTGFIGQAVCEYFSDTHLSVVLTRQLPGDFPRSGNSQIKYVHWDGKTIGDWAAELENADLLLNLSGKSVNCSYTPTNKEAILNSRVESTAILGNAIRHCVHPPTLWINAASATIYPHAIDTARTETFTDFADDFSVSVCKKWEACFFEQRTPFTRKVALRTAIVLGNGGVMPIYKNLVKFGLGGRQGNGKQYFSWLHIEDFCSIVHWLMKNPKLEGIFNASAPQPVTNEQWMTVLRKTMKVPFGLPMPTWMLQLGAIIMGTETELVLKSRWVLPERLLNEGYRFLYPSIAEATNQLIATSINKKD